MRSIELEDVQGYLVREYGNMMFSRFSLLTVKDAQRAKVWINKIADQLTDARILNKDELPERSLNIAFTNHGLTALGLSEENLETFSPPFSEGMVTPHRKRLLGDIDSSAPENWEWGGPNTPKVEIILLVFGKDKQTGLTYFEELKREFEMHGLEVMRNLDGVTLEDNKEHFGFRDGIAQPIINGTGRTGPDYNCVNAGEFILGHKNNYEVFPDSPAILEEQGNLNLLPPSPTKPDGWDIGKNGTYLIIRQMEQDVQGFWEFMNNHTRKEDGSVDSLASTKMAAKFFGRWPSGAPLSKFPEKDPGGASDDNDFLYAKDDPTGSKCPFGSHLRRMNPRDTHEKDKPRKSIILSNRHRLIRRARLYGDPIIGSPTNYIPDGDVGLYFTCFSGDISRQFEFLNYTWSNYPKVKQLYSDPDPIIGVVENPEKGVVQQFTIQGEPFNKTITDLKRFVTIKGGAYFFFPSLTSVRYIASL